LQEGQNWEAIMYASAKKVDNLIATIDLNGNKLMVQLMKFYQWEVSELNLKLLTGMFLTSKKDIEAIIAGMTEAKSRTGKGKPVCVYCIPKWVMEWIS
jgi:transketolase